MFTELLMLTQNQTARPQQSESAPGQNSAPSTHCLGKTWKADGAPLFGPPAHPPRGRPPLALKNPIPRSIAQPCIHLHARYYGDKSSIPLRRQHIPAVCLSGPAGIPRKFPRHDNVALGKKNGAQATTLQGSPRQFPSIFRVPWKQTRVGCIEHLA